MSATVDTAFQPSYTRAASFWLVILLCMLEDTIMPRRSIGLLVAPLTTDAQQAGKVRRTGYLSGGDPGDLRRQYLLGVFR